MRRLMHFTVGFAAGCGLFVCLLPSGWRIWALAAALLLVLGCTRLPARFRPVGVRMAAGMCAALLWCSGAQWIHPQPSVSPEGEKRECVAQVSGLPTVKSYGTGVETVLTLDGRRIRTYLTLYGTQRALRPGDRITGVFTLRPSDAGRDGETNLYYRSRGILLTGYGTEITVTRPARVPLRLLPQTAAYHMNQILERAVPSDALGFLQSILTADRSRLDPERRSDLSIAGAAHIIAISGMHVGILLGILWLLLGRRPILTAAVGIPVLLFFVLLTGASASVVRAAVMQTVLLLAPLFRRENDLPTSLSAAALLILLMEPWAIANISFQLSFGAVAGILLCSGRLYAYFTKLGPVENLLKRKCKRPVTRGCLAVGKRLLRGALAGVSTTVGALLLPTLITAKAFGTVCVYGVVTNLLILWAVPLCFAGGLLVILPGLIPGLAVLSAGAGWLTAWPVRYIQWVCAGLARLPFASVPTGYVWIRVFLVFAYLAVLWTVLFRRRRYGLQLAAVCVALAASLLLVRLDLQVKKFTVTALDVGQGQCILLRTGDFTAVLDCGGGGDAAAGDRAAQYLKAAGERQIDALILSHYDTDHVSGVCRLLGQMKVRTLFLPDVPFEEENRKTIERRAIQRGVRILYVTSDTTLEFTGGSLTIYAPVSEKNDNDASLAVLFSSDNYDMLVTGDMSRSAEQRLLQTHPLPDTELYVAGHHGSGTSSGEALLHRIRPETVLISVGKNSYGLPKPETLERLSAAGARILRTDECGDIEIRR